MLVAALSCSADAVYTLVSLLGRKTPEGNLDGFALLLVQVVVSATSALAHLLLPTSLRLRSRPQFLAQLLHQTMHNSCLRVDCFAFPTEGEGPENLPETHLAVPSGVDVPVGHGREGLVQPGASTDEGGEGDHRCDSGWWSMRR